MNEQVAKALAKQEAKREKKLMRKKEWDELYYKKPKEAITNPDEILGTVRKRKEPKRTQGNHNKHKII